MVAHCGDSTEGMYANTVNLTDIATGWTEQRAVWGKGETESWSKSNTSKKPSRSPSRFDCDNGSEFLNHHLVRHFTHRKQPVRFTRSRAYHKMTTPMSNKKLDSHQAMARIRPLRQPDVVALLNNLYTKEWRLFHNFFSPP